MAFLITRNRFLRVDSYSSQMNTVIVDKLSLMTTALTWLTNLTDFKKYVVPLLVSPLE